LREQPIRPVSGARKPTSGNQPAKKTKTAPRQGNTQAGIQQRARRNESLNAAPAASNQRRTLGKRPTASRPPAKRTLGPKRIAITPTEPAQARPIAARVRPVPVSTKLAMRGSQAQRGDREATRPVRTGNPMTITFENDAYIKHAVPAPTQSAKLAEEEEEPHNPVPPTSSPLPVYRINFVNSSYKELGQASITSPSQTPRTAASPRLVLQKNGPESSGAPATVESRVFLQEMVGETSLAARWK